MSTSVINLTLRIAESSKVLGIPRSILKKTLQEIGITSDDAGAKILQSNAVTVDYLEHELSIALQESAKKKVPAIKVRVASDILKNGSDAEKQEKLKADDEAIKEKIPGKEFTETVAQLLVAQRPIKNWKDEELLTNYAESRDEDIALELNRRANGHPFIVLQSGETASETAKINIAVSLDLLKRARKNIVQNSIAVEGGPVPVYKINELDPQSLTAEVCPICGERDLYRGYCDKCMISFENISEDAKAFIYLVVKEGLISQNSLSDKQAILKLATEGMGSLRKQWPTVSKLFDQLKDSDDLPKLKRRRSTPAQFKDPFNVK
jgi:hypothetical protein